MRALATFRLDWETKVRAMQRQAKLLRPVAAATAASASKHGTRTRKDSVVLQQDIQKMEQGVQMPSTASQEEARTRGQRKFGAGEEAEVGEDDPDKAAACGAKPKEACYVNNEIGARASHQMHLFVTQLML